MQPEWKFYTDWICQHKTEYNLKINLTQKDGC